MSESELKRVHFDPNPCESHEACDLFFSELLSWPVKFGVQNSTWIWWGPQHMIRQSLALLETHLHMRI